MRSLLALLALAALCVARDPICPYPSKEITFFPDYEDCGKYLECFAGNKVVMNCPSDLLWNQTAKSCDYECDWGNGPTPVPVPTRTTAPPGPTPAPTTAPTPRPTSAPTSAPTPAPSPKTTIDPNNICKGQSSGRTFPDPTNCRGYIECDNGTPVHFSCPSGTYFDPDEMRCVSGAC